MTRQAGPTGTPGPFVVPELWSRCASGRGFARAEILEVRRANRRVRGLLVRQGGHARGAEARDATGRPVDPADRRARSFSLVGAFLAVVRPSPWQFRAWMAVAHEAAAEILGDPCTDVFAYNDAVEIGLEELMALLDEIDARTTSPEDVSGPTPAGPGQ